MQIDAASTAWLLTCTGLVLFMAPGLALFYGGMVRSTHVLSMMAQVFGAIAVVSIVWTLVGYSLAFDAGNGLVGGLHFVVLAHPHEAVPGLDLHVPPLAYAALQMMFAVVTAALLAGAGADRMRFGGFLTFVGTWVVVVYAPIAPWVFSPHGRLAHRGVLDSAGGTVVETPSGAAALALAMVLGPRHGWREESMAPHSLPLTLVGAGILWFGWFGFNAGSAISAGTVASQALLNTHLAACAGLAGWAGGGEAAEPSHHDPRGGLGGRRRAGRHHACSRLCHEPCSAGDRPARRRGGAAGGRAEVHARL